MKPCLVRFAHSVFDSGQLLDQFGDHSTLVVHTGHVERGVAVDLWREKEEGREGTTCTCTYLSFRSIFLKLVSYAHVFPCTLYICDE